MMSLVGPWLFYRDLVLAPTSQDWLAPWYRPHVPLTPGSTFERYRIESLIGRGGMGEVYRAVDTRLHRAVALKVLRTDKDASHTVTDAGGTARLLREARAAAALNHANSVAIYELGEAEGIAYIAMELVTGVTFRRYLGGGNVSIETKVGWLVDAARALWAAHKAGLVHRDIKPGNIMVSEEGVVKVLDFGLAKPVFKTDPAAFQTLMGQVLGTPRYMAPEQLEGEPANASADQFAFGLTAYELLSGVYAGGPLAGAPDPLDKVVPGVSAELAAAVARMMARDAASRFPTMEAAAHALRTCAPSVPNLMIAQPTGTGVPRRSGKSDAPTQAVPPEPPSAAREIPIVVDRIHEKGKTLPLALPMMMAMGDRSRTGDAPASKQHMNKTMPMEARPLSSPRAGGASMPAPSRRGASMQPPSIGNDRGGDRAAGIRPLPASASSGSLLLGEPPSRPHLPVSGVYASGADALEAARCTGATFPNQHPAAPAASSRAWPFVVAAALVVATVLGGIAAWFFR